MSYLPGKMHVRVAGVWTPVGDGADVSVPVNDDGGSLTIDAVTLPLPTGAAQEHVTAISYHAVRLTDSAAFYDAAKTGQLPSALVGGRLDANTGAWLGSTAPTIGQKAMASSIPVVLASDQTQLDTNVKQWLGSVAPTVGQKVMASSLPIVVASDQSAVPVQGKEAIDAVLVGNPVPVGGRASNAYPALVSADGDAQALWLDRQGAQIVKQREFVTYVAVYRLAVTNAISSLAWNAGANTDKQLATIYHTAGSTKKVKLRRVEVELSANTTATVMVFELRRLSAATVPATGNPAITPLASDPAAVAAEAACLALPTTAGSEAAANSPLASQELLVGILAGQVAAGTTKMPTIVLWDDRGDQHIEAPIMRAGVAEGYTVAGRVVTASNPVRLTVKIIFTEES